MEQNQEQETNRIPISPSMGPLLQAEAVGKDRNLFDKRVLYLCAIALCIALIMGFVAKGLVMLIGLFTNIFFYGRFAVDFASPANNQLGMYVVLIPVIGGLIVGLMARYGSVAIRGHGIPEAMEQVLENESRIPPRITFLKPLSAAIAIGTGGPFGAEGPIIATGGAFGSLLGQLLKTTPDERKILLAAGATAGMAAVFGTPVSAVLLAIELLLFEFSPRSLIPVSIACATGAAMHVFFEGTTAMFSIPLLASPGGTDLLVYALIGTFAGVLGVAASKIVYAIEDQFEKLPIHWMWWPAIGALATGIVGYFAPETLGVGYDNIKHILSGNLGLTALLSLCFLKFTSWSIALGSGTSGGTLAPLLTIGSAAGALCGMFVQFLFPQLGISIELAALAGMAGLFTGASRAFLTSIVFAFETTLQPLVLLPLLASCTTAYITSFLLMKNTIMTERIARRGIRVPGSYAPDAFERLTVGDALVPEILCVSESELISDMRDFLLQGKDETFPTELPVLDPEENLVGLVRTVDIKTSVAGSGALISSLVFQPAAVLYEESHLGEAISLLASIKESIVPVILPGEKRKLAGIISAQSILDAYESERHKTMRSNRTIHLRKRGMRMVLHARYLTKKRSR